MIATAVVGQSGGRLLPRLQSSRHVSLIICLHSFGTSMEADMSHVKDFVSIHLPTDTFYVGATVRSPEERWALKTDDRSQPSHCDVYSDMYVLLSGHAASIAEREVSNLEFSRVCESGPLNNGPRGISEDKSLNY